MIKEIEFPDIKSTIRCILRAQSSLENEIGITETKTIEKWIEGYNQGVKSNRRSTRDKIFMKFVINLLARQSNVRWWNSVKNLLENEIISIDLLPTESVIEEELRKKRYRFPPQGAQVILNARNTLLQDLNGNWEKYFQAAEADYLNDYPEDPFLKIKYVSFKVRDLALSDFSTKFMAIDSHIVDVLRRTGLIVYAYPFRYPVTTNPDKGYHSIRRLCLALAEKANLEPMEFDRALWHFGKDVCANPPACQQWKRECPAKTTCLAWKFKER